LETVKREINKLDRLYKLYVDVTEEFNDWNDVPVAGLLDRCDEFLDKVTN